MNVASLSLQREEKVEESLIWRTQITCHSGRHHESWRGLPGWWWRGRCEGDCSQLAVTLALPSQWADRWLEHAGPGAGCWLLKVQAPMLRTPPTTRPVPPTSPPPALGPTNGGAGGRSGECGSWSLAESGDMEPLHGPGWRSLLLSSACNLLAMTLKTYFLNPLIFWLLVVVNIFAKYFMQRLVCF